MGGIEMETVRLATICSAVYIDWLVTQPRSGILMQCGYNVVFVSVSGLTLGANIATSISRAGDDWFDSKSARVPAKSPASGLTESNASAL